MPGPRTRHRPAKGRKLSPPRHISADISRSMPAGRVFSVLCRLQDDRDGQRRSNASEKRRRFQSVRVATASDAERPLSALLRPSAKRLGRRWYRPQILRTAKYLIEATIRIREGAAGNYPHLPWASSRLSLAGGAGNGALPRLLYRNVRLRRWRVRGRAGDNANGV